MPKTCYSIFTSTYKNIPNDLNSIKLGDTTIQRTATSKYLSIILDDNLTWQVHIQQLTQDLVKISNSFKISKTMQKTEDKNKLLCLHPLKDKVYSIVLCSLHFLKNLQNLTFRLVPQNHHY